MASGGVFEWVLMLIITSVIWVPMLVALLGGLVFILTLPLALLFGDKSNDTT